MNLRSIEDASDVVNNNNVREVLHSGGGGTAMEYEPASNQALMTQDEPMIQGMQG